MEKEIGQIRFTETDDGYKVEVTGKRLKESLDCGCGCLPFIGGVNAIKIDCCGSDKEKREDCCPPAEKEG